MEFIDTNLIVVSNRLPAVIYKEENEWKVKQSPGGLVTALGPIVQKGKGVWIGWPGCSKGAPVEEIFNRQSDFMKYRMIPISISKDELDHYYHGFSNKTLWPLFHDLLGKFSFDLENWNAYLDINRRFAKKTSEFAARGNVIWIHDYQLLCVGHYLRELGVTNHLNFFLHIPFPSVDLFRRLPWNRDLLQAMLSYDHIGFQTPADRRNFITCIKWMIPEATRITQKRRSTIRYEGREIQVGYYPISIDFQEFNNAAHSKDVDDAAWYLRENIKTPVLALGLDRLDYTKGIPERFLAFERMLEKYPDAIGQLSLLQIVVPSRLNVEEYQDLKTQLDGLAGRINGRFSRAGWAPIDYQFRELNRIQLLGHYRAADIALITPLRDGMNLVAKEYCASSIDNNGVLVLSEFAGAAAQLAKGAIMVNPYDFDGTADAIYSAFIMSAKERMRRMRLLRADIKRNDARRWAGWFFESRRSLTMKWRKKVEADPKVAVS
jgi:trehalose 6-phosphate synthase